jgi:hypothetical protein
MSDTISRAMTPETFSVRRRNGMLATGPEPSNRATLVLRVISATCPASESGLAQYSLPANHMICSHEMHD